MKGRILWYNASRGYGFIAPEGGGADIFAHHTGLDPDYRSPAENDIVEFEIVETQKGPKAINVKKAA